VICVDNDGRVVQSRRGCSRTAKKRHRVVQRVMAKERNAHGPERKSCDES
jgi:hypothetical protein